MPEQNNKLDVQNISETKIEEIAGIIKSDIFKKEFSEHQEKSATNVFDYKKIYQIEPEKLKEPFTI